MHHVRVLALGSAAGVAVLIVACSSIPNVRFEDAVDAEAGAADASSRMDGDGASRDAPVSCPDNPPAPAAGQCCNDRILCLRCLSSDCNECRRENCLSDQVCCKGEGGVVRCSAPGACQ